MRPPNGSLMFLEICCFGDLVVIPITLWHYVHFNIFDICILKVQSENGIREIFKRGGHVYNPKFYKFKPGYY